MLDKEHNLIILAKDFENLNLSLSWSVLKTIINYCNQISKILGFSRFPLANPEIRKTISLSNILYQQVDTQNVPIGQMLAPILFSRSYCRIIEGTDMKV